MQVSLEHPDQPDVISLIAELDAYQDTLYPAEARYSLDLASLCQPHVLFAVARAPDGHAVGCGAIVLHPAYGEVKRLYVQPRVRGSGVASQLIQALEAEARARGCPVLLRPQRPLHPGKVGHWSSFFFLPSGRPRSLRRNAGQKLVKLLRRTTAS